MDSLSRSKNLENDIGIDALHPYDRCWPGVLV